MCLEIHHSILFSHVLLRGSSALKSPNFSSSNFLDAIAPRWAVVQAGYRNRYRHPNDRVVQRYIDREIPILETVKTGAQIWEFKDHSHTQSYWREVQRRTWHQ